MSALSRKDVSATGKIIDGRFVRQRAPTPQEIDGYGHLNNLCYAHWAMEAAGEHAAMLGLGIDAYKREGAGFVVWRHRFDYVKPIMPQDEVLVSTWIKHSDGRVRSLRAFEFTRLSDQSICFKGETLFVCIDMNSGRPKRMPAFFVQALQAAQQAGNEKE